MSQQVINIGTAPNDGSGDQLRLSFNKCNDNFTELYAKAVIEGLWNYNKTSTDTSTSPVSGRFKTNSGNYRDATQIAIHAITIQGIDRTSTLRALLVGDSIQCQDSTNSAAWCRYSLQSLPVDHGTWFQLNVTFQTDGGVTSGDNQEIVFVFTAGSGGGTAAPVGAEYITSSADATLTAERVLTNTATITWDFSTAGQAKASTAAGGGNVSNSGTPTAGQYGKWVTATTIQGVAPATVLSDIGAQPAGSYQPLDGELTAIAGLTSAADQAPYFTGSGAAALMTVTAAARTVLDDTTVGAMLTTMGGLSSATAATTYAPLASPTFTGDPKAPTPTAGDNDTSVATTAFVTTAIAGKADTSALASYALLASPVFTGDPRAPTPATADNDTSIATTAFVQAQGYLTTTAAAAAYQPLDGDLTAIAALTGTNTIYYRNGTNSWAAVNVSTGLAFSGGNLTATGSATTSNAYAVRGLTGTTSATVATLTFHECMLHDAANVGQLVKNGSLSINSAAAVGANGPDATLANGDVSFYAIWGSVPGLAGIMSNANPPTGPTLPATYTHWAYLSTVKRIAGNLQVTYCRGNKIFIIPPTSVLSGGNSGGAWTSVSVSATVPAVAQTIIVNALGAGSTSGAGIGTIAHYIGAVSGSYMYTVQVNIPASMTMAQGIHGILPNVSQTLWYVYVIVLNAGNFTSSSFNIDVVGWEVPNGS